MEGHEWNENLLNRSQIGMFLSQTKEELVTSKKTKASTPS
jgi:hypothetical protein